MAKKFAVNDRVEIDPVYLLPPVDSSKRNAFNGKLTVVSVSENIAEVQNNKGQCLQLHTRHLREP